MATREATRIYQFITKITLRFTCDARKIWPTIKKSQNILNVNVATFRWKWRVQEKQEVKDQQSCMSVFVADWRFEVAARSTSPDMATVFHSRLHGRFIEIQNNLRRKKAHRTNQGSNFLEGSFSRVWELM